MTTAAGPADASLRRLGRDAAVYGAAVVLSRAVSFLLLPLYTRYLTPADFGLLQLLQMMIDVVAIVVSAGTTAGVLRFYYKADGERERGAVLITAFYLLVGLNLTGALVLFPLAPAIWRHFLGHAGSPDLVRLAALNFVAEAAFVVPLLWLQARRRAAAYGAVSVAKLVVGLGLNIALVVGLGKGVAGILVANLTTNALFGAVLVGLMMRETGARPSAAAARDLRRFGIPYQIATAGTFVLTFGDRVFLQAFHGLAAVGIYGLAYQFGFVLVNLTSAPFFRAWAPQRLQMATSLPPATRDARYNQAFRYLNVLVIAAAVAISLYAWPLLAVMSAPAFRPAAVVVPVILAAFVVQIWTDVVSLGIEVSEQTRYASYATWMGVALILALYAILIPPLGGLGAALATIGGNLVRFGFSLRAAQRLWPVAWDWHQPVRIAVLGGSIVGAYVVVPRWSWAGQLAIATVFMAVFAAAVWVAVLSRSERAQILGLLRAPRSAFSGMTSA